MDESARINAAERIEQIIIKKHRAFRRGTVTVLGDWGEEPLQYSRTEVALQA